MKIDYIIVLVYAGLSLLASTLKTLYDLKYYPKNVYVFIIDVLLSTISGFALALLLSEFIKNQLMLMGISSFGGMFGISLIKSIMKFQLGKKIKIQIGFEEDHPETIEIGNYTIEIDRGNAQETNEQNDNLHDNQTS